MTGDSRDRFRDPEWFMCGLQSMLEKHEISQAALARQLGWDRSRMNHYLHGRRIPTLETMLEIEGAVNEVIHLRANIRRRRRP